MAKDTDLADDDKVEQMSAESKDFLEQVRKGKARNFVMSVKGNKVRNLLVKKKKIKEKEKKEMRGQGYQPVFGVATGMGAKITFSIARSDGFDDAPGGGKVEKLKKFLNEQTGKTFKPTWEVVATPPPVPFDDDDLQNPLIAKFMKMEPLITKAVETRPERAEELETRVNTIRQLLQDEETSEAAEPELNELVGFLKELLAGAGQQAAATGPPASETAPAEATEVAGKLAEALKRLKPLADKAINADPNRKAELHGTIARIAGEIKDRQFDTARRSITEFAALLNSLTAGQPELAAGESAERMQQFAQRCDSLEPRLLQAQSADREKAANLGAVWDYADKQAQADNFENAFKALERLSDAIDGVLSAAGAEPAQAEVTDEDQFSRVEYTKAILAFDVVRKEILGDLADLREAMTDKQPDAADQAKELYTVLDKFCGDLRDAVDDELNAAVEDREKQQADVLRILGLYKQEVENNEFVEIVDRCPFFELNVGEKLTDALGAIEIQLRG